MDDCCGKMWLAGVSDTVPVVGAEVLFGVSGFDGNLQVWRTRQSGNPSPKVKGMDVSLHFKSTQTESELLNLVRITCIIGSVHYVTLPTHLRWSLIARLLNAQCVKRSVAVTLVLTDSQHQ